MQRLAFALVRLVFALVDACAHILEDGIAPKASDIDMVYSPVAVSPCTAVVRYVADQFGLFDPPSLEARS